MPGGSADNLPGEGGGCGGEALAWGLCLEIGWKVRKERGVLALLIVIFERL